MRFLKRCSCKPTERFFERKFPGTDMSVDAGEYVVVDFRPTAPTWGDAQKKKEEKVEDPKRSEALCALGYTGALTQNYDLFCYKNSAFYEEEEIPPPPPPKDVPPAVNPSIHRVSTGHASTTTLSHGVISYHQMHAPAKVAYPSTPSPPKHESAASSTNVTPLNIPAPHRCGSSIIPGVQQSKSKRETKPSSQSTVPFPPTTTRHGTLSTTPTSQSTLSQPRVPVQLREERRGSAASTVSTTPASIWAHSRTTSDASSNTSVSSNASRMEKSLPTVPAQQEAPHQWDTYRNKLNMSSTSVPIQAQRQESKPKPREERCLSEVSTASTKKSVRWEPFESHIPHDALPCDPPPPSRLAGRPSKSIFNPKSSLNSSIHHEDISSAETHTLYAIAPNTSKPSTTTSAEQSATNRPARPLPTIPSKKAQYPTETKPSINYLKEQTKIAPGPPKVFRRGQVTPAAAASANSKPQAQAQPPPRVLRSTLPLNPISQAQADVKWEQPSFRIVENPAFRAYPVAHPPSKRAQCPSVSIQREEFLEQPTIRLVTKPARPLPTPPRARPLPIPPTAVAAPSAPAPHILAHNKPYLYASFPNSRNFHGPSLIAVA